VPPSFKPKTIVQEKNWWDPAPWKWCVGGTIVYFGAMSFVVNLARYVPDFDTGLELFQRIYYRGIVNTTYFPLS